MNAELTELVFILDRSGSMGGLESDTIGGFNAMIEQQKKEGEKVNVMTILFDDDIELIHNRFPIEAVKPLTEKEYFVRGCTALLDAQLIEEYSDNLESATFLMLSGASEAETSANLIKQVWYHSIYEKRDEETDQYTRPTDGFANSYVSQAEYYKTCREYYEMIRQHGYEAVRDNLEKWLEETSELGCGNE